MNHAGGIAVALASGLVLAVLAAADGGTLKIQVRDSEGGAIDGAHVVIRPDAAGRQQPSRATTMTTIADLQGRLTRELEAGFFDVCVMSDAFVPTCQKVRIVAGGMKEITVRMRIDRNVVREIGDTFPGR